MSESDSERRERNHNQGEQDYWERKFEPPDDPPWAILHRTDDEIDSYYSYKEGYDNAKSQDK